MATAAESAARGFALTGDLGFLRTMKTSVTSANQHEREVRSITSDNPRQQQRLDKLEPLLEERFQALDDLVDKRRFSGADAVASIVREAGVPLAAAIESLCRGLQNEEYSLLKVRNAALDADMARARNARTIASVFSLLLLGAASALIRFDGRRRRKLETELRHEKDLFTTLMDTVPASVYFKDAESRFQRVNAAMGRRLGLSDVAEAIGKSDADFFDSEHATDARADEEEVFQTGRALIEKEELETAIGGSKTWVMSSKLPMVDRDGTIVGTFGISRDITASKRAEQQLENANSELTGRNDELERRNRESILLGEMGELFQTCVNETEAAKILSKFAGDLCPGLSGAFSMIKASRNSVELRAKWGDWTELAPVFLPEDCWALRRGRTHGSGSANGRIKCAHIAQSFTGAFVCIPVIAHGEALGVLHLLRRNRPEIDEPELRIAKMIAERMGLAVANLRLREALKAQSIRDP